MADLAYTTFGLFNLVHQIAWACLLLLTTFTEAVHPVLLIF